MINISWYKLLIGTCAISYGLMCMIPLFEVVNQGTALESALKWNFYDAVYLPHPMAALVLALIFEFSIIGMLFFKKSIRAIFTILTVIELILALVTGYKVATPLESFLVLIYNFSWGGIFFQKQLQ